MLRTRSLALILALTGAIFLGATGSRPAGAATQGQSTSMTGMAGMAGMAGMSQGAMSMGDPKGGSPPPADPAALGITGTQHITVYVLPGANGLGFTGPDETHHDTFVPSSFVLRKGVPVILTVINLDDMNHSITAPGLGLNIIVKPGIDQRNGAVAPRTTTYTFTPAKAGEFRWFCVFPCDMPTHWAMSASYDGRDRDGFMAGIIRVL